MNDIVVSVDKQRADYERALAAIRLTDPSFDPSTAMLQPHTLIITKPLLTTSREVVFNLYTDPSVAAQFAPDDIPLNAGDVFYATHIGYKIIKTLGTSAVTAPQNLSNEIAYSYADPNVFNGFVTASGKYEFKALEAIFNGKTQISAGSSNRLVEFSNRRLKHVPAAQRIKYTLTNSNEPAYGPGLEDEGLFPLNPNMLFVGGDTVNKVTCKIAQNAYIDLIDGKIDSAGAAIVNQNYLQLEVFGFWFSAGDNSFANCNNKVA